MQPGGPILFIFVAVAALSLCGVGSLCGVARADGDAGTPPTLRATMTCDRASSPGRVRCEVEARVEPAESISWGDVVLLRLPPFATALRGRIGPHDASTHETALWRWTFAVVAREKGTGELVGTVRVVVCENAAQGGTCRARQVEVAGSIDVGP